MMHSDRKFFLQSNTSKKVLKDKSHPQSQPTVFVVIIVVIIIIIIRITAKNGTSDGCLLGNSMA